MANLWIDVLTFQKKENQSPGAGILVGQLGNISELVLRMLATHKVFPRAAITKCHKLGGLKDRNLFSHSSGS